MSTPRNAPYKQAQRAADDSRRALKYAYRHDGHPQRPAQRYMQHGVRRYRPWPRNQPMAREEAQS